MTKLTKVVELKTKRFVIRKSLIGKNVTFEFTNKNGDRIVYNHDKVFASNQKRLLNMNCFVKYGNYTNTNKVPNWAK